MPATKTALLVAAVTCMGLLMAFLRHRSGQSGSHDQAAEGLTDMNRSDAAPDGPEHAMLVHLKLSDDRFGTDEEHADLLKLELAVEQAIIAAAVGEFDGNEIGAGEWVLFIYGPDANDLLRAASPVLRRHPRTRGGYAILRFGHPGDPDAREERIELNTLQ